MENKLYFKKGPVLSAAIALLLLYVYMNISKALTFTGQGLFTKSEDEFSYIKNNINDHSLTTFALIMGVATLALLVWGVLNFVIPSIKQKSICNSGIPLTVYFGLIAFEASGSFKDGGFRACSSFIEILLYIAAVILFVLICNGKKIREEIIYVILGAGVAVPVITLILYMKKIGFQLPIDSISIAVSLALFVYSLTDEKPEPKVFPTERKYKNSLIIAGAFLAISVVATVALQISNSILNVDLFSISDIISNVITNVVYLVSVAMIVFFYANKNNYKEKTKPAVTYEIFILISVIISSIGKYFFDFALSIFYRYLFTLNAIQPSISDNTSTYINKFDRISSSISMLTIVLIVLALSAIFKVYVKNINTEEETILQADFITKVKYALLPSIFAYLILSTVFNVIPSQIANL